MPPCLLNANHLQYIQPTNCRKFNFGTISGRAKIPAFCQFNQRRRVSRPVMQGGRIKIRTVWPDYGANFRINPNLIEKIRIMQRPIQPPMQQRLEVDRLFHAVFKSQFERVRRDDRDALYKMDGMLLHAVTLHNLAEWRNRQRRFAGLQTLPVRLQFGFV